MNFTYFLSFKVSDASRIKEINNRLTINVSGTTETLEKQEKIPSRNLCVALLVNLGLYAGNTYYSCVASVPCKMGTDVISSQRWGSKESYAGKDLTEIVW